MATAETWSQFWSALVEGSAAIIDLRQRWSPPPRLDPGASRIHAPSTPSNAPPAASIEVLELHDGVERAEAALFTELAQTYPKSTVARIRQYRETLGQARLIDELDEWLADSSEAPALTPLVERRRADLEEARRILHDSLRRSTSPRSTDSDHPT